MVNYGPSVVTSKIGVGFVRSLVERAGSLFHKIEQESDLGIDALIELVVEGSPAGAQVAVQIKSGDSYYETPSETCLIPISNHREYWSRYPLPVVGVVFIPSLERAYWVDVKRALRADPEATVIRFVASGANLLDRETFASLFMPPWLRQEPRLAFEKAIAFSRSRKIDEAWLGLRVLFHQYPNEHSSWDALVEYFVASPAERIPPSLIYHLAHIPWHGDIAYSGEAIEPETREYAAGRMATFRRAEIVKLLGLIDRENGIARGTLGQSIEAVLSSLPGIDAHLMAVASDESLDLVVCESAGLILAMHLSDAAIPMLRHLATRGSWFASELVVVIREFGGINPYG
jgi:hypothetical protein